MALQDINITRCIKLKNFSEVVHCSLYYFPDAWDEPIDDCSLY